MYTTYVGRKTTQIKGVIRMEKIIGYVAAMSNVAPNGKQYSNTVSGIKSQNLLKPLEN